MVLNRKPDPSSSETQAPEARRGERAGAPGKAPPGAGLQSVIGSDLSIEGQTITIRCKGSLTINGTIEADVHSSRLEVGKEAMIQGAIAADNVDVYGRVNGSIMGTHVVLHSTAEVEGDIHSHLLSIEQGAAFDGRSRRVADRAELTPQLERPLGQVPAPAVPSAPPYERAGASAFGARLHS
jgi:cytoskeletal protein CcmA (bactofilin family)